MKALLRNAARVGWQVIRPVYHLPSKVSESVETQRKASRCIVEPGAVLYPSVRISNNQPRDAIRIGAHSRVLGRFETLGHGGRITVGQYCFIGEDSYIWSAAEVRIGDRVLISHGVNIHDHIAHSLSARDRHEHFKQIFSDGHPATLENVPALPVRIEDDVWIGFGATVLKGVTIGKGAVVGAQSLVTKDVEPYAIVVGNPARVIGRAVE